VTRRRFCSLVLAASLLVGAPLAAHADGEEGVAFIAADDVRRFQTSPRRMLIVDVRSAAEYQEARIAGAVNVPLTELERRYTEIPRDGLVVLY